MITLHYYGKMIKKRLKRDRKHNQETHSHRPSTSLGSEHKGSTSLYLVHNGSFTPIGLRSGTGVKREYVSYLSVRFI